jgi:hypothetical protein
MFETIVGCWFKRLRILVDSTQRSFFKTTSTKEAAKAIALEKSMEESKMDSVITNNVATENKALCAQTSQRGKTCSHLEDKNKC